MRGHGGVRTTLTHMERKRGERERRGEAEGVTEDMGVSGLVADGHAVRGCDDRQGL